ncbi:MAG: energy transducer TonB [Silvibacterium sp.]|jgi:TonB family protein
MTPRFSKCLSAKRGRAFLLMLSTLICLSLPCSAEERKVQKRIQPVYPELARRMHLGGVVRISATVAADGSVTEVKTISGNKMLSLAAEEAVKKWKFVAGESQSTVNIDVNFDVTN